MVQECRARGLDTLPDALGVVGAEVVEDDDIAGTESWHQVLVQEAQEHRRGGSSLDSHQRFDAVKREGADHGRDRTSIAWHDAERAAAFWSPCSRPRHRDVRTRLVEEDQAARVARLDFGEEGLSLDQDLGGTLLPGHQRFFLRVNPSRRSNRHMVGRLI